MNDLGRSPQRSDRLDQVRLGENTQWIRIRGQNVANPVLLLIPQGPGLPLIQEADDFQRSTHLEDNFTVVYWDPRGCGKSARGPKAFSPITLDRMVKDAVELIEVLCARLETRSVFVAGFSLGGTIGALAAARVPDRVAALIAVGMDVQFDDAERVAYDYVLAEADRWHNARALRQLHRIGTPPHLDAVKFGTRVRWLADFGGVMRQKTYLGIVGTMLRQLFVSDAYSLADLVLTLRGMSEVQTQLLPDLAGLDLHTMLPRLEVPIYILHGVHDYAAPLGAAESYFHNLIAPQGKQFILFHASAHMPHYEEPDLFARTLLGVLRAAGSDWAADD
ncbi:MAG: alpha/beta fold hydrolase [Bacilli bacterium]